MDARDEAMETRRLFEHYYYARPAFRDGTETFHRLCRRHLRSGGKVLEVGAGPANKTSNFLSGFVGLVGVDISYEVRSNGALAVRCLGDAGRLPFRDGAFDGCISNYVIEHLREPEAHLREVARLLRPGGVYCFRTPNLWHYVTLASRMLPYRAHLKWANWLRALDRAHEPYPTYYRMNTAGAIRRAARRVGLDPVEIERIEAEPTYGRRHALLFYPMMLYERLVNASPQLAPLRMNLLVVLAKPD
jgi:SAM-dependent methyltransferase